MFLLLVYWFVGTLFSILTILTMHSTTWFMNTLQKLKTPSLSTPLLIMQLIILSPLLLLGIVLDRLRPVPVPLNLDSYKKPFVKSSSDIKVMSYNVQCCLSAASRYAPTVTCSIIVEQAPDIVLLQELTDRGMDGNWIGTTAHTTTEEDETIDKINQIELLVSILEKQGLHYEGVYHGPHELSESLAGREGTYGIGILVLKKHRILKRDTLTYTRLHDREVRGAVSVDVEFSDKKACKFICTHLQHDPTGYEQFLQALELIKFAGGGNVVIGGDMNCGSSAAAVRTLGARYGEKNADGGTFPFNRWLTIKLDHLFCGGSDFGRTRGDKILKGDWSDHYPVLCFVGHAIENNRS